MNSLLGKEINPLVSIVIPCHNAELTIEQTLNSVISQTYKNLNIVVFNNFSSDNTSTIVASFLDERIKYFKSSSKLSMADSWTAASKLATGDYLLLLCADDLLLPTAIEILYSYISKDPSIVQVFGARRILTFNGKTEIKTFTNLRKKIQRLNYEEVLLKIIRSGSNPFGETAVVLFRKNELNSCLPWSSKYFAHIDVEMYIKVSKLGISLQIPFVVGKWRFGSLNTATSSSRNLFAAEFKNLIKDYQLKNNLKICYKARFIYVIKSYLKAIVRDLLLNLVRFLRL